MRYEQRMRKYWQKKLEDPLPKLPEDERIYLNVPYIEEIQRDLEQTDQNLNSIARQTQRIDRGLHVLDEQEKNVAGRALAPTQIENNGNYTYGKYGISNLSKAQDKLIDGLAEYGARWAKEDGFPEMAEEMEKRVGISKGIEKIIEPQAPKRSRGYEMEL